MVVAGSRSMSLSRHQRKAVRVLPVPVGARMRVDSPREMAGQPSRWGGVAASKTARNHSAVMGWKRVKTSVAGAGATRISLVGALGDFPAFGLRGAKGLRSAAIFDGAEG